MANTSTRHKYYDTLNLIGYGLSKFDKLFINEFGYSTKTKFYEYIVELGIAETTGVVKNRQDLFDGMDADPSRKRKGWWQKGDMYKHRKDYIDSLFGALDVYEFVEIVRLSIAEATNDTSIVQTVRPILRSRYKQLQITGLEAESYFINNYSREGNFVSARLEDARLLGDGYDFQLTTASTIYLAEVKGIHDPHGHIRMTKNEYEKAVEYKEQYALTIISNLIEIPQMTVIYNPVNIIPFEEQKIVSKQIFYRSSVAL
jgi:hypothetical protein